MVSKLEPPKLDPIHDTSALEPAEKPDLRTGGKRPKPELNSLITPGFVTEATIPGRFEPDDVFEGITIEVPRRVKRALQNEVSIRRNDPQRRIVASMKSVILEALVMYGFRDVIRQSDIEVQAGIFMKRQSAQMRRR